MTDTVAMAREPYEQRGILHSEAAWIIAICQEYGISRLIESGRARGQSTYMLAKYMPHVEVHSVELRDSPDEDFARARLVGLANVKLYMGDARDFLPLLAAAKFQRTAILCDGPKGEAAVKVVRECFSLPQVMVGFIHDMRRLDHGEPSPHRECAVTHFAHHQFSDDPALLADLSWMDAGIEAAGGPCGPRFASVYGSYGPTIGAFLNPTAISNQEGFSHERRNLQRITQEGAGHNR